MTDSTAPNDKRDLLAAYDQVVDREKRRSLEAASGPGARRTGTAVLVLGLLALAALGYIWGARPAWLFQPDAPPAPTAEQREATLRFGMYLESERIRDYQQAHGRLPARLEDAGDVEAGIGYAVTGDTTYILNGQDGGISLTWHSTDSMREFLAPAGITPAGAR